MGETPFDRNQTKEARLGAPITESGAQNQRDAVHIAVVPVIASRQFHCGERVGISHDGKTAIRAEPHVGIVDPFLPWGVREGETFWLLLFQGSVTTLRHEWTHPAFPSVDVKDSTLAARGRLDDFARECGQTLDRFIDAIKQHLETGDPIHAGDNMHAKLYAGFWEDLRLVTGIDPGGRTDISFTCAC